MQNYVQGNSVRVQVTFEDSTHAVADPTAVVARIMDPASTTTVYTYGVGPSIVRVSLGIFYIDIDLNAAGIWSYRFEGTGVVKAASQDQLLCVAQKP